MQNNMELIPEFQTLVDKAIERNAGKPMRIAIELTRRISCRAPSWHSRRDSPNRS